MEKILKKISIVVACYNESANIENMYKRVKALFDNNKYNFELLFVDNASTDNSKEIYKKIISQDNSVKAIIMSRNFGSSQPSFFAGLKASTGDAVVLIDGDLQDPPELISNFIKKWEEGYDVVYAVRKKRKGSILRRIFYKIFYRIFKYLSYIDIPLDAGDFGLISRKVVDVITALPEKDIYLRGLRSWVGFKQVGIEYVREDREGGKTSNSFLGNIYWVKKAVANFSDKPLIYVSRMAITAAFFTVLAIFIYLYLYFRTSAPKGFYTLLMAIFIFSTLQLLALGVIAEYLIRIFQEVKQRPPFIVGQILENKNGDKL